MNKYMFPLLFSATFVPMPLRNPPTVYDTDRSDPVLPPVIPYQSYNPPVRSHRPQ